MTRPLALDLFCGAGGASMGLHRAGFEVVGVDVRRQKRYPFRFVQADALRPPLDLRGFPFVWASPPCQHYTKTFRGQEHLRARHPDLVDATRQLLAASGALTCIENVPGAPLRPDLVLTGAQFDLPIVRDRTFELEGFAVPFALVRQHVGTVTNGDLACVAGQGVNNAYALRRNWGGCKWRDLPAALKNRLRRRNCADGWREAMQIDWMTRDEITQAVPPAYAEHIGRFAIEALRARAAA